MNSWVKIISRLNCNPPTLVIVVFRWLSPWTSNHVLDDIHLPSIFEKNKAVYDVMMILETKNKQQTVERLNQTITVIPDDERPKEMPPSLAYHVTENLYKSVQYLYNMLSLHSTVQIQGTFVHFRFYQYGFITKSSLTKQFPGPQRMTDYFKTELVQWIHISYVTGSPWMPNILNIIKVF